MIRITQTKQGLVRGLPAADPYITAFKGFHLQNHQLENLDGEHLEKQILMKE